MIPQQLRTMSVNKFLLLVVLYIVAFDNKTLWLTLWNAVGENPLSHWPFLLSFVVFVVTLTLLILLPVSFSKTVKPSAMIILVVSAITAYYVDYLHVIFSESMIQNVFQTDIREASELINADLLMHIGLYGVLPSILVAFIKIESKPAVFELLARIKLLVIMLLVTGLSIFWTYKDFTLVLRENRSIRYLGNPIFPVSSLVGYLTPEQAIKDSSIIPVFEDAMRVARDSSDGRKDILVVVIGETARAANFSLNGYERETNPNLKNQDIINYSDTSSCGTATAESLPCMFSILDRASFSNNEADRRENVLDGLKRAGIDVMWRDNNSGCKGICKRVASHNMSRMKVKGLCNSEECYDEILLHKLDGYVNKLEKDAVLVLHLKGSHGPAYYKRFPKEFARFTPECNLSAVQNCERQEIVNSYDNTILYNDYVLSKIIDYLKQHADEFNTGMIYMSDHGESLGENGIYLHGLPYFLAPDEQTHVPFIVWLSDNMQLNKGINSDCLNGNSDQAHSHDNLVHSILGIMDVSTAAYDAELDVFASCRKTDQAGS